MNVRYRRAVLGIFVLSGAAGLIYEIVWARQLVLVFGNTTQAISTILTGFFGGMALGAALGGRLADRVRSPLRLYGMLEVLLVVVVLATPLTFQLISRVYGEAYDSLVGSPWLGVVRLVLALVALAPATVLMGATFPSLVRHLSADASVSASFGRLYSANTIGAILGTLAAGLILIELFGLSGALAIGAACSGAAGLVALWLARVSPAPPAVDAVRRRLPTVPMATLPLAIAFMSGLTSLGYQVTWTRLLSSGTGGYTYVFTIILTMFLVGLAVGASLFNILRPRIKDPIRFLVMAQLAVSVLAVLGLFFILAQSASMATSEGPRTLRTLIVSSIVVVLPVTTVLGLTLPTTSMLLRGDREDAGSESGSLLAVNTVGAILGSLVIPFVLMPAIGSPMIVLLLAASNVLVAMALVIATGRRYPAALGVGAMLLTVGTLVALRPGLVIQPGAAFIAAADGVVYASVEDEIASVQAGQTRETPELWVGGTSMTLLTVDAKLMPIIPLMARPDATEALVVAFGMGSSFRSALIAGLETEAVEIVPSVPRMFGHFFPDATRWLSDPRARIVIADGRNHLALTDRMFDIIVTDPPPPIESSGASVISSLEYLELGRARLKPGGIMMQWVPLGSSEAELRDHIRTFASAFPQVTVIRGPGGYGLFMLGSGTPFEITEDRVREVLARPGVLDDISSAFDAPVRTVDDWIRVIDEHRWLDDAEAAWAYAGEGPLITDDNPRPEYFLIRRAAGSPTTAREVSPLLARLR